MQTIQIDLLKTEDYGEKFIGRFYGFFAEAAATCLEENNFNGFVTWKIEQDQQPDTNIELVWEPLDPMTKEMRADLVDATEHAACCIAFLVIHKLTNHKIVHQARRGTGFDYWLADKNAEFPFQRTARLEISGILNGGKSEIKSRIKQKEEQITQSANLRLPAYIIISEFSQPLSKVVFKNE